MFRMKKAWYAILITLMPWAAPADEPKILSFELNDIVTIYISNNTCPLDKYARQYPYVATAVKFTDSTHTKIADAINACWTHRGDIIVLQWNGGDRSEFPANYFLKGKMI